MENKITYTEVAVRALEALLGHAYVSRGIHPSDTRWELRYSPKRAAETAFDYAAAFMEEAARRERMRSDSSNDDS